MPTCYFFNIVMWTFRWPPGGGTASLQLSNVYVGNLAAQTKKDLER